MDRRARHHLWPLLAQGCARKRRRARAGRAGGRAAGASEARRASCGGRPRPAGAAALRDRHGPGARARRTGWYVAAESFRPQLTRHEARAMTEPQRPDLPQPPRPRWLPLRLGLVELFHYDSEEFWFRDGHLLLRGNNGTGKSKVLSLTLPFLLDANLSSSRVEPDGDRSKRMDWNLLLGGVHERRIGYAWIEFGRIGDDGTAQFRTLGCGLRAVAGRPQVDAWYFMTRQRVGETLWLTTDARTVIAKARLGEAIAGHGQVFDTAQAYRRAVDEALF